MSDPMYTKVGDVACSEPLTEPVRDVTSSAMEKTQDAASAVVERVEEAASAVADTFQAGQHCVTDRGISGMIEDVTTLIRRHPYPALAIGFTIGLLIARATRD